MTRPSDSPAAAGAPLRQSYSTGLAFGAASFGTVALIGVVSGVVMARLYGIDVIGEYALAYAPTGVVWFLSNVREQAALVRELATLPPREPRVTGLFAAVLAFSTGLTVAVSAVAVVAMWFVFHGPIDRPDLFAPATVNLAVYAAVTNVGWNLDAIFSAFVAGRRLFWIRLNQALCNLVVGVVLGIVWGTVWGLVAAAAAAAVTSLLHRVLAVRALMRLRVAREVVRDGFRTLPDILRFSVRAAPGTIFHGVSNELATWVLGFTQSIAVVGAYNRAWLLGRKFLELNFRITELLLPTLVRRRGEGDRAGFDRALVDTMRYAFTGMLAIAGAAGGAAAGIMAVFGPGFERAAPALALLLLLPGLQSLSGIQSHAFYAVDRPLLTTVTAALRLVATLVITVVGVAQLGLVGAAIGVVAGLVLDVAVKLGLLRRELQTPFLVLWTPRQLMAAGLAYGGAFATAHALVGWLPAPAGVLAALPAGVVAYAVLLRLAGGIGARDIERLQAVLARVSRRRRPPAPNAAPMV